MYVIGNGRDREDDSNSENNYSSEDEIYLGVSSESDDSNSSDEGNSFYWLGLIKFISSCFNHGKI